MSIDLLFNTLILAMLSPIFDNTNPRYFYLVNFCKTTKYLFKVSLTSVDIFCIILCPFVNHQFTVNNIFVFFPTCMDIHFVWPNCKTFSAILIFMNALSLYSSFSSASSTSPKNQTDNSSLYLFQLSVPELRPL